MKIAGTLVFTLMVILNSIELSLQARRHRRVAALPDPVVITLGHPGGRQYQLTEIYYTKFGRLPEGYHEFVPSDLYWTLYRFPDEPLLKVELIHDFFFEPINRGVDIPVAVNNRGDIVGFYLFESGILKIFQFDLHNVRRQITLNILTDTVRPYHEVFRSLYLH